jgi:plastocyanin
VLKGGDTVQIKNYSFSRPDVAVPVGARLRWTFGDSVPHNVTVADGPRGFASLSQSKGGRFSYRFMVPGTYRLFCSLHPWMSEVVVVGKPG